LIVLGAPGAPAREVLLPHAFRVWLVLLAAASLSGSMMVGRSARAWVEEASAPGRLSFAGEASLERSAAQVPLSYVPLSRFPLEPDAQPIAGMAEPVSPGLAGSLLFSPVPELAATELALYDVNGKRSLTVKPFDGAGMPEPGAFDALKAFLRCRRTGKTQDMNPRLMALLSRISQRYDRSVVQIISAHRAADGVVTQESSQHVRGTAADIRIAGVSVDALSEMARSLGAAGVGVYPEHRFVHVDVRARPYFWRASAESATAPLAP
jgi:uncharacterized protein YcbK (DUF882 family)